MFGIIKFGIISFGIITSGVMGHRQLNADYGYKAFTRNLKWTYDNLWKYAGEWTIVKLINGDFATIITKRENSK